MNASAFLDPKIQAKWETLYPGTFFKFFASLSELEKILIDYKKAGAGFVGGPDSILVYNSTSVTHQLHCVVST